MKGVVITIGWLWLASATLFIVGELNLTFNGSVVKEGCLTITSTISYVVSIPLGDVTIGYEVNALIGLLMPFFLIMNWDKSMFSNHFLESNCMRHK